jgi:alkylhydroperoxidase family enzyme
MIYSENTNLLFPPEAIASVRAARGVLWQSLVDEVLQSPPDSLEQMAFLLMMARLNGCATCNVDSYRALQGCSACAHQALRRFRGRDEDLQELYHAALREVEQFLKKRALPPITRRQPEKELTHE